MSKVRYLAPLLVSLTAVAALSARPPSGSGQVPGGFARGGRVAAFSKVCYLGEKGAEECSVELHMRASGDICPSYAGRGLEMCVWLVVKCPAGIPAGDPEEICTSEKDCEVCPAESGVVASVTCGSETFSVEPKPGKVWGDVFQSCSAARINVK